MLKSTVLLKNTCVSILVALIKNVLIYMIHVFFFVYKHYINLGSVWFERILNLWKIAYVNK